MLAGLGTRVLKSESSVCCSCSAPPVPPLQQKCRARLACLSGSKPELGCENLGSGWPVVRILALESPEIFRGL